MRGKEGARARDRDRGGESEPQIECVLVRVWAKGSVQEAKEPLEMNGKTLGKRSCRG